MKTKKITAILCSVLVAGSMLAACGGQSSQEPAAASSAPAAASASEAAASSAPAESAVSAASEETEEKVYNITELSMMNGDKHIYGEMYLPAEEAEKYPTIVLSHGFGGSTASNRVFAEKFSDEGFAVCLFDFCGGGKKSQSDGDMTEMSVLTESADLNAVIDYVETLEYVDTDNLFLLGESQGGFVTSYTAPQRVDEIKAVVLYYPAFALQADAWERHGSVENIPDTEEFMGATLGRIYSEDAMSFDIFDVIGGYNKNVLIIHGDADTVAPIEDSEKAVEIYENATLEVIEGATHGWGGGDRNANIDRVAELTVEFLKNNIG